MDGGWVPLNGTVARKRFGTRFTTSSATHPREEESDGPAPKRLKQGAAEKDCDRPSGQISRPSKGVIDLSKDHAHEPAAPGRQRPGPSRQPAVTIDLASDEEDDGSPPQPSVNPSRDPRLQLEHQRARPTRRETLQHPQLHSSRSGSPVSSSAVPTRDIGGSTSGGPRTLHGASSDSDGPLWSRQCTVNRIAPDMVPATWTVRDDPPQELVHWLRTLLTRAGQVVEVSGLRRDKGGKYSCKLTMGTKKAMLHAISLNNLPDRCEAHGKPSGDFLHIANVPRPPTSGGDHPYGATRPVGGGESSSNWRCGWGEGRGGARHDSFQPFIGQDAGQGGRDEGGRRGGYVNGGGPYTTGWGGGDGFRAAISQPQRTHGNGWGGGGHDSTPYISAEGGWAGPGPVSSAWVPSAGWGNCPQSTQSCVRCGGTSIPGCPHKTDCEEVRRCIMSGADGICFVCGGTGHTMARCPLPSPQSCYS